MPPESVEGHEAPKPAKPQSKHKIVGIPEYDNLLGSIRSKTLQKLCILYWCLTEGQSTMMTRFTIVSLERMRPKTLGPDKKTMITKLLKVYRPEWVAKALGCSQRTAREYLQVLRILFDSSYLPIDLQLEKPTQEQ